MGIWTLENIIKTTNESLNQWVLHFNSLSRSTLNRMFVGEILICVAKITIYITMAVGQSSSFAGQFWFVLRIAHIYLRWYETIQLIGHTSSKIPSSNQKRTANLATQFHPTWVVRKFEPYLHIYIYLLYMYSLYQTLLGPLSTSLVANILAIRAEAARKPPWPPWPPWR